MEDRQRHGPAERARQREERARERHRTGAASEPPADRTPRRTDRAAAPTATPYPYPSSSTGRRGRGRPARGRAPRLAGATPAEAGEPVTAPPHPHRLVQPAALAAGVLLALDLLVGLVLGHRVVALQVAAAAAAAGAGAALWVGLSSTRRHGARLTARLAETSVDADARQVAVAELVVNLARRNQSLVDRQLGLIDDMEQKESEPDALGELFRLDHLATRIRRHAESLLVLAGDESPSRSWRRPVLLTEVARAAAAEVEDYRRVDVLVGDDAEVTGRVVADLAHLLAELIENATTYSPAERRVQVRSHTEPSGDATRPSVVLAVEDNGIGMTDADRAATNRVLAEPMVLDLRGHTMGMHVVARLAHRYGIRVRLDPTPGGGLTALVTLPAELVSERDPSRPARPATLARRPSFKPVPGLGGAPSPFTPGQPPATPAPALPAASARPPARPAAPAAPVVPVPVAPANPAATPTAGPPPDVVGPGSGPAHEHARSTADREHVRSMLSRFQASQRAGRALADAPPGSLAPAPTPATATRPVQEDS